MELHHGFKKERIKVFLTNIDIASDENDKKVPYFFNNGVKALGEDKQADLLYGSGLLISEGGETQANGYYFKKDMLIRFYKSIMLKPLNIEHDSSMIVGTHYDVALAKRPEGVKGRYDVKDYLIKSKDIIVEEDKAYIKGYDGPIDMWVGFIVYKTLFPEVSDYIKNNKERIKDYSVGGLPVEYKLGLSMEVWFDEYGYLFDNDESTLIRRTVENSFLDSFIGNYYENDGVKKRVYKVYLDSIVFAGAAFTEKAAEKRSFILDAAMVKNSLIEGNSEEDLLIYNEAEPVAFLTRHEMDETDFVIDAATVEDPDIVDSLFEVSSESDEFSDIADILKDSDISAKIKERKGPTWHKSKPQKYKDIPTSQFADPVNYKYPLNSPSRVRAAIVYFLRYGGRYTPEEQKTIWRKILRAANKYKIKVSEKVQKKAKASFINNPNEQEEEEMKEIQEMFDKINASLADLAKKNGIDENAVKGLIAEEKINLIKQEFASKEKEVSDLAAKNEELEKSVASLSEENKTLKEEAEKKEAEHKEALEKANTDLEASKKELETANASLGEYTKKERVVGRLNELKSLGLSFDESRIEAITEKASSYADEKWKEYVDGLKDVSTVKPEPKKDGASVNNTESLVAIGKEILSAGKSTPANGQMDVSSIPGDNAASDTDPGYDRGKRQNGMAVNFPSTNGPAKKK